MRILIFLVFLFLPAHAFASLNVLQTRSTHALGFDVSILSTSALGEIRVYASSSAPVYSRGTACAIYSTVSFNPNATTTSTTLNIRPQLITPSQFIVSSISNSPLSFYSCTAVATHTVALFSSPTDTTPDFSDTIYLEQFPLDFRSVFMLIFIVGALLAILRPIIKTLTLK